MQWPSFFSIALSPGWLTPKQKGILLMVRGDLLLFMVLQWLLSDSLAILWGSGGEWWNPLCASTRAITSRKIRKGNESEDMLLHTFTPPGEFTVPATLAAMPIYPPLPPPSVPIQPQFPTLGLRTVPPYKDQLEHPVLVSGVWGLGLVSPSKTRQGSQLGPGATPRAGQFSLLLPHIGG